MGWALRKRRCMGYLDRLCQLPLEFLHLGPQGRDPIRLESLPHQLELIPRQMRRRKIDPTQFSILNSARASQSALPDSPCGHPHKRTLGLQIPHHRSTGTHRGPRPHVNPGDDG